MLVFTVLAFSGLATVTAEPTSATYKGYSPSTSIGHEGLQNYVYNTGQKVHGLCVDAFTFLKGTTHPVTPGTKTVVNANKVKLLIVQNFFNVKSKLSGQHLTLAVWYFTNGIKSNNANVNSMINKAKNCNTIIPDKYVQKLSTTSKSTITSVCSIKYIGTCVSNSSVIKCLGSTTSCVICGCKKIITTVTCYSNTTTTTTVKNYLKVNTTTNTTVKTTKENCWNFNTINCKNTQKIILFTVTPKTVCNTTKTCNTTCTPINTTDTCVKTTYFNTTCVKIVPVCPPCKPPVLTKPPCKPPVIKKPCKPVIKTPCKPVKKCNIDKYLDTPGHNGLNE